MITTIIIIGFGVLLLLSLFIIINLYRKVERLEGMVADAENTAINVYNVMLEIFVSASTELERVDKRGAFASDDEVGFTFRIIKEVIEQVKYQILKRHNENSEHDIENQ